MNSNCLAGFKCPKCAYEKRFDIEAKTIFTMMDDGEDAHFDIEWEDHHYCKCNECGFESTVSHFRGGEPTPKPDVDELKKLVHSAYEFMSGEWAPDDVDRAKFVRRLKAVCEP